MPVFNKKQENCCGCRACETICPVKAISMREDNDGFLLPEIDNRLCVNCGKCDDVCSFTAFNADENSCIPKAAVAGIAINKVILSNSSSGGAFTSLCYAIEEFVGEHCVIYGATLDDKLNVHHVRIDNISHIHNIQKSKYVQSDLRDVLTLAKKDIKDGKYVIFSGTPCQVAGLRNVIDRNNDKLFTIDLICHGVPSQKFFDSYIDWLSNNKTVSNYSFRSRETILGDTSVGIEYCINGKRVFKGWGQDPFMNVYLKGYCYRESCYVCPFANEEIRRFSDFTIADCWGIEKEYPELDSSKGVSSILFNTQKAIEVKTSLSNYMDMYEIDLDFVKNNNSNLVKPNARPSERHLLYESLNKKMSFKKNVDQVIKKYGKPHIFGAFRRLLKNAKKN